MNDTFSYTNALAWLDHAFAAEQPPMLPLAFYALLAIDGAHRDTLVLLLDELLEHPPVPAEIDCDACDDDLAAFIDLEQEQHTRVAAHTYPQVWWHLWTCPACQDIYLLTRDAVEADPVLLSVEAPEQVASADWLQQTLQATFTEITRMPRLALNTFFQNQPALVYRSNTVFHPKLLFMGR